MGHPQRNVVYPESIGPRFDRPNERVRRILQMLTGMARVVLFVDEFDRPNEMEIRAQFADTIKILSDHGIDATIVLVGVGSSVGDLLAEHASISRSLVQISMPVMSSAECSEIVKSGVTAAEMTTDQGFVDQVVHLAQGFPHYVHLIAQHGARFCIEHGRTHMTQRDSEGAVAYALEDVSQSIWELYHRATSSHRETIYAEVLLACAMATKDDLGRFGSADLRGPLARAAGRYYDIPAYSTHLSDFSSTEGPRGGILQKSGTRHDSDIDLLTP